ncbi:MAG: hypothetical protein LBG60_16495 [Bifidobacteriaceae bacterium]|jgi:Asp-tRNA(Asn)/Glu-tRNA(Gln) amidotransferase A subunit family amidase|nr:hypothetical protein [Bifidobacteriaceae bacterium]
MRRADALDRPAWADLDRCAELLASGGLTARRLVSEGLERIAKFDDDRPGAPGLRAVIAVNPTAEPEARASDARRAAGRPRSRLDGVTFMVKDSIETAGTPTTHGSELFAEFAAERDAPAVARLRAAGLIMLGKTSLDDFAAACFGESSLRGATRNPHDDQRMVGGSSGGSAAAVAAGYVPLALGSDTGGSLRIPAALTGLATFRPSLGQVPFIGAFPGSPSQDVIGPMALGVSALAAATRIMSDAAGSPPTSGRPGVGLAGKLGRSGAGLAPASGRPGGGSDCRAGRWAPGWTEDGLGGGSRGRAARRGPGWPGGPPRLGIVRQGLAIWGDDPDGPVSRRFDQACRGLERAGWELVELTAPPREMLDGSALITAEAALAVDGYLRERPRAPVRSFAELFASGSFTRWAAVALGRAAAFEAGTDCGRRAADQARAARRRLREATDQLFARESLAAVAYPSVQRLARPLGVEQSGVFTRWSEHTGRPSLGLPLALVAPDGGGPVLPCSLELLGHEKGDFGLLELGRAAERLIAGIGP